MENSSNDFLKDWVPSRQESANCREHGLDSKPIRVRVSKIRLKSGEMEVLVSSLYDMDTYSLADIGTL